MDPTLVALGLFGGVVVGLTQDRFGGRAAGWVFAGAVVVVVAGSIASQPGAG